MTKVIPLKSGDPLIGSWKVNDGFPGIVVTIKADNKGFEVSAVDENDDEIPEVFDLKYENDAFSFNLYFNTNGRLIKYRFQSISKDRIDVTFSYSGQETWERFEA